MPGSPPRRRLRPLAPASGRRSAAKSSSISSMVSPSQAPKPRSRSRSSTLRGTEPGGEDLRGLPRPRQIARVDPVRRGRACSELAHLRPPGLVHRRVEWPCQRWSRFQSVSPWRTRSSVVTVCTLASHGVGTERTCLPRHRSDRRDRSRDRALARGGGGARRRLGRDPERVEQARAESGAERGVAADVGEAGGPETAVAAALGSVVSTAWSTTSGCLRLRLSPSHGRGVGRALAGQRAELRPRDPRCRPTDEGTGRA